MALGLKKRRSRVLYLSYRVMIDDSCTGLSNRPIGKIQHKVSQPTGACWLICDSPTDFVGI